MTDSAHPTAPTVASGFDEPGEERLPAGAKAGDYVIEEHVGAGAMGDVYRANHPVIGKKVAIKVIKRKLAGSAEALERFVREARAVNKINHPNVVDVFAMDRLADGRLWLAMSFLDGESLGRRLRRTGSVPVDEFLDLLRPVCEALTAAHAQGVVHRDLKTDNIFVARGATGDAPGRVYVLDFGIAKVLADVAAETAQRHSLTGQGAWIGTPAYMAPEQWTSEGASFKSDVYALGVVAYEMLSGHPPFTAPSLPAIMEQHFRAEPPPLSTPSGGVRVPQALEEAVRRALAKRPEERPESAMAFLALCEGALGETGVRTRPRGGAPMTFVSPARRRRRLAIAIALAAGVVGAGVLAIALGGRGGGDKTAKAAAGPAGMVPVVVMSEPRYAKVIVDGEVQEKSTPVTIQVPAGKTVKVRIEKPGFRAVVTEVGDDPQFDVTLEKITGFEGVWEVPRGRRRAFEHKGDMVAGYEVEERGSQRFLRNFVWRDQASDVVTFGASDDEVHGGLTDEPTCHIQLWTEYRYNHAADALEQRRQQVGVTIVDGKCRRDGDIEWTAFEPCRRLATRDAAIVESRAGTGQVVNVVTPDDKPPVQTTKKRPPQKGGKRVGATEKDPPQQRNVDPKREKAEELKRQKAIEDKRGKERAPAQGYEEPQQPDTDKKSPPVEQGLPPPEPQNQAPEVNKKKKPTPKDEKKDEKQQEQQKAPPQQIQKKSKG
jgi:tRNA A-37 threonylcarbamoyl transferase component Bud32